MLRKCREKYGMNLCRGCQRTIEPRVKRPKLKVCGSNKTSKELRMRKIEGYASVQRMLNRLKAKARARGRNLLRKEGPRLTRSPRP